MSNSPASGTSPFRQPRAVWAVAFACVISFMGIGLVDPILPALSSKLQASPSQVEPLFTSYLVVTAVAMLVTGFVWIAAVIGGGEFRRSRVGQRNLWKLFGWTIAVEIAILVLSLVI